MYTVIKYIHDHIAEDMSIEDMAKQFGYSPWYFCKLFHRFTGMTFGEYVRHQRIQLAALEILGDKKSSDVAVRYGYETLSGFNKAFLKEYGCLPREFKKKSRAYHIQYKEKRAMMRHLSDRCQILRENAVNRKTMNRKILAQHPILFEEGIWNALKKQQGPHSVIASGMVNVMTKSSIIIQDGELLVGYNYADLPFEVGRESEFWSPQNTDEDRELVMESGFTERQFREYLEHHDEVIQHWQYDRHVWEYNITHNEAIAGGRIPFLKDFTKADLELDDEWAAIGRCMSDNHSIIGYEKVLKKGFSGLLQEIESAEKINGTSDMYDAMKQLCHAAGMLGRRYANAAKQLAKAPDISPARRAELEQIAHNCSRVPEFPAETFWEAVQSLWFAHLINTWEDGINANSLGRLDQILYPYYKRDVEKGILNDAQAFDIICCLWIKLYRDLDVQQSCVGGCNSDGQDAINELSYMMLDATEELDFIRCLSVRFSPRTEKKFLKRALEVVGHVQKGVPFFFNDDVMIPALTAAGISLKDARGYTQIGCVETVLPGMSNPHAVSGETNLLKAIEYTFGNGSSLFDARRTPGVHTGPLEQFSTFASFKDAVYQQIENILQVTCKKVALWTTAAEKFSPKPYKSLLSDDCIQKNLDFNNHGVKYDFYQIMLGGIPNLADSLMVIKQLVYEKKKYSLQFFYEQLTKNFPDEAFRQECLHKVPKFGNDIDEVDELACDIIHYSCDVLKQMSEQYKMSFHAQPFTFLWMVEHGLAAAASPDGRKRGEIIAYSVSPMQGRDFNGFTALMNSLAKLPTKRCPGSTSAIVEVDPKLFTDSNIDHFADILLASAEKGVCNVQFNTIDADTMIDAQKHPELHNNLAVRVSGFSQKFNLLDKPLQDHIIGRTKHKCL